MLLSLSGISRKFDDEIVLSGIHLSLGKGESVAVVAPSGAGKSTLLSIAGLLLSPNEGCVEIDGEDASGLSDNAKAEIRAEKIGFLFQHTQLVGSLRAYENVSLAADFAQSKNARKLASKQGDRSKEMLAKLGLKDRLYHYPHQLSVGQKRRVATARALNMEPQLIIADEPTNDLDAENAHLVVDALFEPVQGKRAGLLFATHDPELAARADRIYRF